MYELAWTDYARAAAAAVVAAPLLGFAGAFLLPPSSRGGLFYLAFALLLGMGAGAAMSEAVQRASGGKRGTSMQLIAAAGVVAAVAVRLVIGGDLALFSRDTGGALAAVAGAVYAWSRLR